MRNKNNRLGQYLVVIALWLWCFGLVSIGNGAVTTRYCRPTWNIDATGALRYSDREKMKDLQIATFRAMMRTVNAGDADGYARLYAPDAVITIYGSDPVRGQDAIRNYEVELLKEFPGTQLKFYDLWSVGANAIVHYGVNGKTPNGKAMGHEGLLFYRFEPSGLIAEERRYLDSLTPMAQLGVFGLGGVRPLPDLPDQVRTHHTYGVKHETENVAVVRSMLAALDSQDEKTLMSKFADKTTIDELIEPQPYVGVTAAHAWFDSWRNSVTDARSEVSSIVGVGDFVLIESIVRGTLKNHRSRVPASTQPFTVHRALIIQIAHGKIQRISAFMNGKELAESTGQWPLPVGGRK